MNNKLKPSFFDTFTDIFTDTFINVFFIFFIFLLIFSILFIQPTLNLTYACSAPIEPIIGLDTKTLTIACGQTFEVRALYTDFQLAPDFVFDFFHGNGMEQKLYTSLGDSSQWAEGVFPVTDKRMLESLGIPPTPVSDAEWSVINTSFTDQKNNVSAFKNSDYKKIISVSLSENWSEMPPDGYLSCLLPGCVPDIFVHPDSLMLPDFMSRYSDASEKGLNIIDSKGTTLKVVDARWIPSCKWQVKKLEFTWNAQALTTDFEGNPLKSNSVSKNTKTDLKPKPIIKISSNNMSILCNYPRGSKTGKKLIACRARVVMEITGVWQWHELKPDNTKIGPFSISLKAIVKKNNYLEGKILENMTGTIPINLTAEKAVQK